MSQHDLIERMVDYFHAGGGLMVPLIALSLLMWTLVIVKGIRFQRERRREIAPDRCVDLFRGGGAGPVGLANWQWNILAQYMRERSEDPELNREMLGAIRGRQESLAMRHIGTILILAAVAPLLGLLGTVTGMITTFEVISEFGTGNARALASGISEALVTTQSGLVVAVPGLLLGVLLYRQAERMKRRMELFCLGLQEKTDIAPAGGGRT
jgi:biopolymer transport protein ExbB